MQINRNVPSAFDLGNCADVIEMTMRNPDRFGRSSALFNRPDNPTGLIARIYDRERIRIRVSDKIAIFRKRTDRNLLHYQTAYPPDAEISGSSPGPLIAARYF